MSLFDTGAAAALNYLLAREEWARQRLSPFAGEVVELRFSPLPAVRLAIVEGGHTAEPGPGQPPTLTLSAKPGILGALSKGEDHLMRAVDISGNARLASEILALLRYLRWDVEEDLSRVVGDVLAHRMVNTARGFAEWHLEAGRRLAENVMEYAIDERRLVVSRAEFDTFASDVAALRDDLERLDQRLEFHPKIESS